MSAKILSIYDYDRERTISCPCGWSGVCSEAEDYFREVLDVRCQECDRMLLIVPYASHAETKEAAAAGNEQAIKDLERVHEREAFFARAEERALTEASELPDLDGDEIVIKWDFERDESSSYGDSTTILRHGDRVIWREIAFYEGINRFEEVLWILREKYGTRLAALEPTDASIIYLCGDDLGASSRIDRLNGELEDFRAPDAPLGYIDTEDVDINPDDPDREKKELLAAVEQLGEIECPCGWGGDCTEATVVGEGDPLEVFCPECRRPLFQLTQEEPDGTGPDLPPIGDVGS